MNTEKLKELLIKREQQIDNSINKKHTELSTKFNIILNDFILKYKDEIKEFIYNCKILYNKGFIVKYSTYDDYWINIGYNAFVSDKISNKIGFVWINDFEYGYGVITNQNDEIYITDNLELKIYEKVRGLDKQIVILEALVGAFPHIKNRLDEYISKIEKKVNDYDSK